MYITIEGIKGSGKSTLIEQIMHSYSTNPYELTAFPMTAAMSIKHPLEQMLMQDSRLKTNDDFLEVLFKYRAHWNQPKINSKIILGDRSIATAIVSRWNKWNNPFYTMKKVKYEYQNIITPNVIIWLDTPVKKALENIDKRKQKALGKSEETEDKLMMAKEQYEELLLDGLFLRKMTKTQIIKIKNYSNCKSLQQEIISILNFYKK
jgi:thymidylate kinase